MASYFFRNNTTAWNLAANWSLTDGGGATGAIPLATDDAFFSNNSGNVVMNSGTLVCKTLDFTQGTGFTGTVTMTVGLAVSGSITLNSAMGTISGAGTLTVNATATLTSNGKTWATPFAFGGTSPAFTIAASNWTTGSSVSWAPTGGSMNGNKLNCGTGLTCSTGIGGTTEIVMIGTGNYNGNINFTGGMSLTFNTSGTITFLSGFTLTGGTITYTAGTINVGTNTITIGASSVLNTNGINWYNITIAGSVSISSLLTVTNTLSLPNAAVTFSGSSGWITNTLISAAGATGRTWTLVSTNTYTINSAMTINTASSVSHNSFISSSPGTKAILTLKNGATQDLSFVNATDIDSSNGQTIWTYKGTITTSLNWNTLPTEPKTIATQFVHQ